jgi:protein-tyrosine phosphatase
LKNKLNFKKASCSKFGEVVGKTNIIPLKTPFEGTTHTVQKFIEAQSRKNLKIKMIIDLTDSTKYYSPHDVPRDVKYEKIRIKGGKPKFPGGEPHQIKRFIESVESCHNGFIGVHCTHGLNRTGFLVCYYLLHSNPGMKVEEALQQFNEARTPGFHKREYIDRLYQEFDQKNSENYQQYVKENFEIKKKGNLPKVPFLVQRL